MESSIFTLASMIGSIAFALSGFFLGVRKQLDIMGLFIVAMLTANGGGAVRDVLVGRTPSVLTDINAFFLVTGVLAVALLFRMHTQTGMERRLFFVISDSIGLVAFSVTGALIALQEELSLFGVLVLAFMTATGGGIIRDVIINEVPAVLSSGFYGSVALIIAAAMYGLSAYDLLNNLSISAVFCLGLLVRLVAHFREWHLPRIEKGRPYLDDTIE
jgi:uncharacterized membrane protein YeiH